MNTKTNHKYASNTYSGGIMGSDSPAALLDMLAEVASQTLHSEKKRTKSLLASPSKPKADFIKRKAQEASFNVPQLLSMPASQLVKQFSIFTSDELKRQYSYTCALIVGCGQKYSSFASEGKARMSIKAHLAEHLEYLKTNEEAYNFFTVKSVSYKNCKASSPNKKGRLQQSKKPQETINKENKNVIAEKSTNYLRNILLKDASFKEIERQKNPEQMESPKKLHNSEHKDMDRTEFKVLGDHSYFERLKDEVPNRKQTSSPSKSLDNMATDESIVLMVVGTDSVHMKEYSHINQKLSENVNQDFNTVYLPEISWSNEGYNKSVENTATTKPKGKAKFIGTSKEEREMALAFMDRIKKKGNPTGSNLECRICNPPRSFTAPTTLVSHYRSHAGIKPYECRICRAVFTRRHSLKYHMLIHQNQTRFTCADCGKKFRHPSHFREHRRRHTGEAPFGCEDCGQRFKTRNTYKRHLKTRHGKVLTTTGELLYLSEEDFQKVRTNRKKKNDFSKEHMIDEDVIAANAIMNYQDDNGQQQNAAGIVEEYIIGEDANENDGNWEENGTVQIIKKCFRTREICMEPHLIKTEILETEIPINNRVSDSNGNSIQEVYIDKIQDDLPQLQSVSYDHSDIVENQGGQIVCGNDVANESKLIYQNANETSSYIKLDYISGANQIKDGRNTIEYQENIEFIEDQIKGQIQIIQHNEEDYCSSILQNEINEQQVEYIHDAEQQVQVQSMETFSHITGEEYEGSVDIFASKTCQRTTPYDRSPSPEAENLIGNENILQTVDRITNNNLSQAEKILQTKCDESTSRDYETLDNCHNVVADLMKDGAIESSKDFAEKNREYSSRQIMQHLYVHNEPLTGIIVQNKRIDIVAGQFNTCNEQQKKTKMHRNNNRNCALLSKETQAASITHHGKQSAILLLTDNALKNSIFRIDKPSPAIKE